MPQVKTYGNSYHLESPSGIRLLEILELVDYVEFSPPCTINFLLTHPGLRGVNPKPGSIAMRDIHGIRDSFPPSPLHCNDARPASIIFHFTRYTGMSLPRMAAIHFSIHPKGPERP